MAESERRLNARQLLRIRVRYRPLESPSADPETPTHTIDISRSGLFLSSPRRLTLGSLLSLNLRVPTEISGSPFVELRCKGRVVHERPLAVGSTGYGIEIEEVVRPLERVSAATAGHAALA